MAYKKTFNPDALPAHAEPEQAAQALAQLSITQKPTQNSKPNTPPANQARPARHEPQRQQQYGSHNQQQYQSHYNQQPPPQDYYNKGQNSSGGGYGWNSRPPQQQHQHQHQQQQQHQNQHQQQQQWGRNSSLPPPDPDSADLHGLFRAANASRTGSLTSSELGNALVNADYTPFDPRTISSLMRMFSTSPQGQAGGPTVTYNEFQNLWRFLAEWRRLFERFDEDQSGRISLDEFSKALDAFGYRLTTSFVSVLYNAYNGGGPERRGSSGPVQGRGMTFDLFVQACLSLKRMTDVFKNYDDDRDGYVTLSFEEFLTEMLRMLG